jgi:oligoribonuclease NrnB/cAMP/cGMP phosphodiesterase (DHH superfamily)
LLKQVEDIESIEFAHPKDVQDGKVPVDSDTILTNLPFVPGCGLWFDHHSSETQRIEPAAEYEGACEMAPSATRVVYEYYEEPELEKYEKLVDAVDKSDSASYEPKDITDPEPWILLSFVMDPRTNLGKFHDYRISNRQLMHKMVDFMEKYPPEEILELPDVKERVDRYYDQQKDFEEVIKKNSYQKGKVVVTDLRGIDVPAGNRFLIHVWYPDALIALRVFDGYKKQFGVIAGGYNIFDKSAKTNLGELMAEYGGGGHAAAATCQLPYDEVDEKLAEIVDKINEIEEA